MGGGLVPLSALRQRFHNMSRRDGGMWAQKDRFLWVTVALQDWETCFSFDVSLSGANPGMIYLLFSCCVVYELQGCPRIAISLLFMFFPGGGG